MKKTSNMLPVLLVTVIFSAIIATGIAVAENFVGADKVFIAAICLLPITFIWMLIVDYRLRKRTK